MHEHKVLSEFLEFLCGHGHAHKSLAIGDTGTVKAIVSIGLGPGVSGDTVNQVETLGIVVVYDSLGVSVVGTSGMLFGGLVVPHTISIGTFYGLIKGSKGLVNNVSSLGDVEIRLDERPVTVEVVVTTGGLEVRECC